MRKITKLTTSAFFRGQNLSLSNTKVVSSEDYSKLYLHDNLIAVLDRKQNLLSLSDCGWQSNTTKERLNGLLEELGKGIYQKNWTWYVIDLKTRESKERKGSGYKAYGYHTDWNEFKLG